MRRLTLLGVLFSSVALAQAVSSGGISANGVPSANQIALWATPSSIKGDSNLAWDPTNKKLTILGTASSNKAIVIPSLSVIDFSGGSGTSALSFGGAAFNINTALSVFGNITAGSSGSSIATTGSTNNISIAGATTTNPVTLTASGSDSTVGINLVPKSTGTVQNNGDPIVAVHHAQTTAQVSMEFGTAAASANALAVTFSAAFSSAPSCTCADNNATPAACGISVAASTSGVTFKGTTGATDNVSWVCVGLR